MIKGTIFNIQRFSLHDGPGIRTTVFFKGCPLNCIWCQNPEGIAREPQLIRQQQKCISCYSCLELCPQGAVKKGPTGPIVDPELCRNCFLCSDICPAGAVEKAGQEISAEDLAAKLLQDRIVFEESGGGVTFSGGEPFMQPAFLIRVLKLLKQQGIKTAIETCGYTGWSWLEQAAAVTDLFIYDLKLIDEEQYLKYTGISGNKILGNLKRLVNLNIALQIRMPLIKGINDQEASQKKAAAFLMDLGIDTIELIPYHNFGEGKYEKISRDYQLKGMPKYSDADLQVVREILKKEGIKTNSEVSRYDHS
jgi:pyruvate formate lyase activating enzyme